MGFARRLPSPRAGALVAALGTLSVAACASPKAPPPAERAGNLHSEVACRACGAWVEAPRALTFEGHAAPVEQQDWLYIAADACMQRASREGWSLAGDLQVEVSTGRYGAGRRACGAHGGGMDPRLASCLLDALDAEAPREANLATYSTVVVPAELKDALERRRERSRWIPRWSCRDREKRVASDGPAPLVRGCAEPKDADPAVEQLFESVSHRIRSCYLSETDEDPTAAGRVSFTLQVGRDGVASQVCDRVTGPLSATAIGCIDRVLLGLRFPAGTDNNISGSYSFENARAPAGEAVPWPRAIQLR